MRMDHEMEVQMDSPVRSSEAWDELEAIARKIDPSLPADLSGYEVRITLNRDFKAVECLLVNSGAQGK